MNDSLNVSAVLMLTVLHLASTANSQEAESNPTGTEAIIAQLEPCHLDVGSLKLELDQKSSHATAPQSLETAFDHDRVSWSKRYLSTWGGCKQTRNEGKNCISTRIHCSEAVFAQAVRLFFGEQRL
jgi:hypothetical protein